MAERIKVAVIGTGALGRHHARLYAAMQQEALIECTGVYDRDPEAASKIANEYGLKSSPHSKKPHPVRMP